MERLKAAIVKRFREVWEERTERLAGSNQASTSAEGKSGKSYIESKPEPFSRNREGKFVSRYGFETDDEQSVMV